MFIDIACSNAVGKFPFMALNMWMTVNWQVFARKRSWLNLRKSACIYMMWLAKITEDLYEGNRCAIRGTWRSHVNDYLPVLPIFNRHTQTLERKLANFTVVVSTNVHPVTSPMCLSTTM